MSEPGERIFRQPLTDDEGNVAYGPEEIIDAGPFEHPGLGSFIELEDGWYRLRPRAADDEASEGQESASLDEEISRLDRELQHSRELLGAMVADYDRRRASRRGRFLLWLLRRTT